MPTANQLSKSFGRLLEELCLSGVLSREQVVRVINAGIEGRRKVG